jgi:hypothetical protein
VAPEAFNRVKMWKRLGIAGRAALLLLPLLPPPPRPPPPFSDRSTSSSSPSSVDTLCVTAEILSATANLSMTRARNMRGIAGLVAPLWAPPPAGRNLNPFFSDKSISISVSLDVWMSGVVAGIDARIVEVEVSLAISTVFIERLPTTNGTNKKSRYSNAGALGLAPPFLILLFVIPVTLATLTWLKALVGIWFIFCGKPFGQHHGLSTPSTTL